VLTEVPSDWAGLRRGRPAPDIGGGARHRWPAQVPSPPPQKPRRRRRGQPPTTSKGARRVAAAAKGPGGGGESFLRVHWVAVPKGSRARRANRRRRRRRQPAASSGPAVAVHGCGGRGSRRRVGERDAGARRRGAALAAAAEWRGRARLRRPLPPLACGDANPALAPVRPKRLLDESPWLQFASECQRV
jgi:hypothetical protein